MHAPEIVQRFETFKAGAREQLPDVPFQMLTALDLGKTEWAAIARHASWQMTRMNLNTFASARSVRRAWNDGAGCGAIA